MSSCWVHLAEDKLPSMKILLVDDNAPLREFAAEVLRDAGHQVVEFGDGRSALEEARKTPLDLLITDFDMPGLDGLALCDHLRADHPRLPTLLVTTHCGSAPLEARRDIACLDKPFSRRQLLDALRTAHEAVEHAVSESDLIADEKPSGLARPMRRPGLGLAAAVAACVILLWITGPGFELGRPALPEPSAEKIRRSAHLEVITPQDVLPRLPEEVSWHPVEGAAWYRFTFESVDGRTLYSSTSQSASWPISPTLRQSLPDNVAYYWQVEAANPGGKVIARSPKTRFRVISSSSPSTPRNPR